MTLDQWEEVKANVSIISLPFVLFYSGLFF
jgi:hypothetical protein